MNKRDIVEGIVRLVVSASVGVVIGNAVKATTPDNTNLMDRVLIVLGESSLSGVLADLASQHVISKIEGTTNRNSKKETM